MLVQPLSTIQKIPIGREILQIIIEDKAGMENICNY